jgi:RNA-directed DNA polymerase
MFMAIPYKLNPEVATILAQICCHNNELPQGAPTSPIISNMICSKMDSQLQRLSKEHRCIYSRYADDLTFSTSMPRFPSSVATLDTSGQVKVGHALTEVIRKNGFEINTNKVRLQMRYQHQEVTELTTNKFPNVKRNYVRQIRAMLHAWRKYGLDAAQIQFHENYDKKSRSKWKREPNFKQVVKGKIEFLGMVRGKDNSNYLRFRTQLKNLAPELYPNEDSLEIPDTFLAKIITEGITDGKHLKAGLNELNKSGLFTDLLLDFQVDEADHYGDSNLLESCKYISRVSYSRPIICIFDSDDSKVLKQVTEEGRKYKQWGNNVFSFALPIPEHRRNSTGVCIELYYKDEEIKRYDKNNRRLYLSNEFRRKSGQHKEINGITCTHHKKISSDELSIIDDNVFNGEDDNIALPKNDFADNVLNAVENFSGFDFSEFVNIFNIIQEIIKSH